MSTLDNPYLNPLPAIHHQNLYGRDDLLKTVVHRLLNGQSFEIIGVSRIGKSSLLNVIASVTDVTNHTLAHIVDIDRERQSRLLFIPVNAERLSGKTPGDFWQLMGQTLITEVKKLPISVPISDMIINSYGAFEALVESVLVTVQDYEFKLVFLFDEFDLIVQDLPVMITVNLRALLGGFERRITYLTATQRPLHEYHDALDREKQPKSPLHNVFFPAQPLGLLDERGKHSVFSFITEPSYGYGVRFSPEDVDFARTIGGRHPDITRITCFHLFEQRRLQSDGPLNYEQLFFDVYTQSLPVCNTIWRNLLVDEQELLIRSVGQDNKDLMGNERASLNRLRDLGLVEHLPAGCRWFSPIFEQYLDEMTDSQRPPEKKPSRSIETSGELVVWKDQNVVQVGGKMHNLRPKEAALLAYLVQNKGRTCTREELRSLSDMTDSSLDSTLSRLRHTIEADPDRPRFVKTVRGEGYRFEGD